ncbi:MAG: S49 family peptidase [Rickettsiales bacterium]|nr:S49 family peptidase [Rickettsiales bacterium]
MNPAKRCIGFLCKVAEPVQRKLISPPGNVVVVRLEGVIGQGGRFSKGGLTADTYAPLIKKAFSVGNLKAVAVVINSPGGSPVQSALLAQEIRYHADKKNVPVLCFIEDCGASGGYWLACAGDEIFAMEASIVGSIGVIAAGFGFQDLLAKHGIERRVHTSGKSKALLDPFQPEKPADVKVLKEAQTDIYEGFVDYVKERRGDKLKGTDAKLFSGTIFSGKKAHELGLVDGLGDFRSECRDRFGEKVEFKTLIVAKGFFERKMGMLAPNVWADAVVDAIQHRLTQVRLF